MKRRSTFFFLLIGIVVSAVLLASCGTAPAKEEREQATIAGTSLTKENKMKNDLYAQSAVREQEIYLAAGCFWGAEAYFKNLAGVLETEVGYANGKSDQTTYHELSESGHAETVRIRYNSYRLSLAEILERYYRVIDPFSVNRQGNDIGTQYRSGVYYSDPEQEALISYSLKVLESRLGKMTAIEVKPLRNWVLAEEYHQDYLDKNPTGYCHINPKLISVPLWENALNPTEEELREKLPAEVYHITREKGTEAPYSHAYDQWKEKGIYVDVISGRPLFSSLDKYDAGCGWPSFTKTITTDAAVYLEDLSYGMQRIEVEALDSGTHLGHVFEDGPANQGGLRFCINGASLRFIPLDQMKEEGYEAFLPFVFEA